MKTLPAIFIVSLTTLLIACGKDKFETKPKLEIKGYNSKEISNGQGLRITINYFDKEGDLNDAQMIGIRDRLNSIPPNQDLADTSGHLTRIRIKMIPLSFVLLLRTRRETKAIPLPATRS
jgi:hypothetical protein